MLKTYTCITCPIGCDVTASVEGSNIAISGNLCSKGEVYVKQELTEPKRIITSSVLVEGGELSLVSVRLTAPIPKEQIFDVMGQIKKVVVKAPVSMGQVLLKDVLGLKSDVIATKEVPAHRPERLL